MGLTSEQREVHLESNAFLPPQQSADDINCISSHNGCAAPGQTVQPPQGQTDLIVSTRQGTVCALNAKPDAGKTLVRQTATWAWKCVDFLPDLTDSLSNQNKA